MSAATAFYRRGMAIAASAFVADQASKALILYALELPRLGTVELLPFLAFTMVWNAGISMGIPLGDLFGGADAGRIGLIVLTLAISLYLWRWLRRSVRRGEMWGLGLVLGGAMGNLVDRVVYGAVADFIHVFGFGYHFYVFNVADAAISIGVIVLIADSVMPGLLSASDGSKTAQTDQQLSAKE